MADQREAMDWIGKTVVDRDGSEVGACTTVLFDDTGAPEWLGVDHAGVRRKLPAGGATTEGGRVQVQLTRLQIMESPRLADTPPTSDHKASGGADKRVMGALGALGAIVVAFLTMRWLQERRQPPPPAERLVDTAREAARRAAHGGATVVDRTVAVAAPAAVAAGKVAAEQGRRAAKQGMRAGGMAAGLAATAAATAAEEVGELLESGAEVGHRVGGTIGAAPDVLAESGKRLRKKWRRLTGRIVMVVALAGGYVAGSAAGRQRYEEIKRAAGKVGAMASSGGR